MSRRQRYRLGVWIGNLIAGPVIRAMSDRGLLTPSQVLAEQARIGEDNHRLVTEAMGPTMLALTVNVDKRDELERSHPPVLWSVHGFDGPLTRPTPLTAAYRATPDGRTMEAWRTSPAIVSVAGKATKIVWDLGRVCVDQPLDGDDLMLLEGQVVRVDVPLLCHPLDDWVNDRSQLRIIDDRPPWMQPGDDS